MRKLLTAFLMIAVVYSFAFGQWQTVTESDVVDLPNSYAVIDANTVVTVNDDGLVTKTTDGGASWTVLREADGSGIDWNAVEFADANTGYAVGSDGFVFKTTDGGSTWAMVGDTANYTLDLKRIEVLSADVVWCAGNDGMLLKSTDGGSSFVQSDSTFDEEDLDCDVAFCSENVGVVAADGTGGKTWYTHDGGASWNFVTVAPLFPIGTISQRIYDIATYGDSTVVVVGYHYCTFMSTDGGKTYSYIGNLSYGYEQAVTVSIVDANTFVVAGTDGFLVKTTDAGANWETLSWGSGQKIGQVNFTDANNGYVFGYYGQWFTTADGGANFSPVFSWPKVSFWGLAVPETDKIVVTGYAGGEQSVSTDGGATWSYPTNEATGIVENLYECEFFDANVGIVGGSYGVLARTTDGGASYTDVDNPMVNATNKHINAMHVFDATTAFAGGSSGYLMKSSDAGQTWTDTKVNSGTVYDIWALDANTVLASESSGKLCYAEFDASGAVITDSLVIDVGTNAMRAVEARNGVVIVPASSGVIFRTTVSELDTLVNVFDEPDGDDFYDVEFITDDLVFVVGENGKVYYSEDAGLTWTAQNSGVSGVNLQKVKYDGTNLWAVGQDGYILKLDRMPGDPYALPLVETGDNGVFDLEWTMNTAAPGAELTIVDSTASDWGSYVMNFDNDGYTGIAHIDNALFDDYTVSSDIYLIGPADAAAPLYAGLTVKSAHDAVSYYRFVYRNSSSSDNGILKLQGYDGASWHISAAWYPGVDFDTLETGWHNLKITVKGNQFCAYINGQLLPGCPYTDDSPFLSEGYPGIFEYSGASVQFDNFTVTKPEATPIIITMEVDMSVWAKAGKFSVGSDSVDVAGSFNDWGGNAIWLDDADGDTVYSGNVYGVFPGDAIEYKFRINGSWDDNTAEFPYGAAARTYTATEEDTTLFHFYNDEEPPNAISDIDDMLPKKYALHQNYPNPFNPTTTIAFDLPKSSKVNLVIYNLVGQEVMTLKNEMMNAGFYRVNVDASRLSSGVYFYRIQADNYTSLKKMTLLK